MGPVKAGAIYFLLTFAAGFIMGPVRELVLAPQLGTVAALLVEAPVMLVAMSLATVASVKLTSLGPALRGRIEMSLTAVALLTAAEIGLSSLLRGWTLAEWLRHHADAEGLISIVLYVAFAICPLVLARGCRVTR